MAKNAQMMLVPLTVLKSVPLVIPDTLSVAVPAVLIHAAQATMVMGTIQTVLSTPVKLAPFLARVATVALMG
jgi:hypothetical protein